MVKTMPNRNTRAFECRAGCPPEVYKNDNCWKCCRTKFDAESINCKTCSYKFGCITNKKGG